ncbi:MAG: hypothetical protein HN353_06410 [Bdellovibrionales bacterium]|nr:hypothetical protein [Bdellovibrionales bacterium]MBT3526266.1 hypothetical protein [Bdellovibrionales bacterium]MBT7766702.1 hypothetical protein [Bdellovibrionales bacterium]
MKKGLLLIERIILESLEKKEKNIIELAKDTTLSSSVISNVLPHLMMRSMVNYQQGIYHLIRDSYSLREINAGETIGDELKELFSSLVNRYFQQEEQQRGVGTQLRLKKVWMTPMDEAQFNAHLVELERFLARVEQETRQRDNCAPVSEQRVVFWGHSEYSQLINGSLMSV